METRLLYLLGEERRRTVEEKTRQNNRLRDCLKLYFPQVLAWFDEVDSPLVGALRERWPRWEELRRAHPSTLRKFFQEHDCRSAERIQERIEGIYAAVPANDAALREAGAWMACGWVALLAALRRNIDTFDRRIAELVQAHSDGRYLHPCRAPVRCSSRV